MKGNLRKFLSLLVAVAMLITVLPTAAFAAEGETVIPADATPLKDVTAGYSLDTGVYRLDGDIPNIIVESGKNVTIYLNGHNITGGEYTDDSGATNRYHGIINNGTLKVVGTTGTETVSGRNGIWVQSGSAEVENCTLEGKLRNGFSMDAGTATLTNVKAIGATNCIWNGGTLTVDGGTFTTYDYNSIYSEYGSVTITDGTFGNIESNDNSFKITGGTFNESVSLVGASNAEISGGTFAGTVSVANGEITGGTFQGLNVWGDSADFACNITGAVINGTLKVHSSTTKTTVSNTTLNGTLTWDSNSNIPTLGDGNTYGESFAVSKDGYTVENGEIKPLPKYTVTVASADKNKGTINVASYKAGSTVVSDSNYVASWTSATAVYKGTSYSLTVNAKVSDGYVFKGWFYDAAGTGEAISTATSYTVTGTVEDNTTIYAVFESKAEYQAAINKAEEWIKTYESTTEYTIASIEDMYAFAHMVNVGGKTFANKKVNLTADLDYTGSTLFMPVGTNTNKFNGTFDGQGHTISNLNVAAKRAGLFGTTDSKSVIQNLTITDSVFTWADSATSEFSAGGAIAAEASGTIKDCTVNNPTVSDSEFVGGAIGHTFGMTIENVTVNGGTINGRKAGGVAGYAADTTLNGVVVNSTVDNKLIINNEMTPETGGVGGAIVGHAQGQTTLKDAKTTGTTDNAAIGIVHSLGGGDNNITVTGKETNIQADALAGGLEEGTSKVAVDAGNYTVQSIVSSEAENTTPDVTITGGTYTKVDETTGNEVELDVTEYIPEDMMQDTTTGEVKEDPNKAVKLTSGETVSYYPTIAAAVAEAKDGDTVTLLRDVTISEKVDVAKSITLDLNGKKLINDVSGNRPFYVIAPVKFTVEGTKEGSGVVNSEAADGKTFGFIDVKPESSGATVTLNGGTYTGNTDNGALIKVRDQNTTTIVLNNVTAETNMRVLNTGVCTTMNVTVTGGSYTSTNTVSSTNNMYAVFGLGCDNGGITCDGVTITTNGAVCVEQAGAKGTFTNCNFTVNSTSTPAFIATAVAASSGAEVTIDGGNYSSAGYGAYVYNSGGTIDIKGGATITGGVKAVQADTSENSAPANVNISDGVINGDIFINSVGKPATLTVTGGTVNGSMTTSGANSSIAVSGGTFKEEVKKEYCAEGFAPTANEDGSFGVQIDKNEAVKVTTSTGDVAYYATLADAVANAGSGDTVTLLRDLTGSGVKVPSGTDITIDFGGFTYTVTDPAVGSTGTATNGFQLLRDSNITFKNGTIKADPTATGLGIMIQNYSDLTLEDMTIDGSENANVQYVLSCNNGASKLTGNTNIKAPAGQTAMDVYYWPSGSYNSVSLTLDETMAGTVEGNVSYGDDGTAGADENAKLIVKAGTINGSITEYGTVASAETTGIEISGGTFSEPVKEEFCAAGFGSVAGSGNYTVQDINGMEAKVVSSNGEVTYVASFKIAAQNAMENDEVILLQDNVTLTAMNMKKANVTLNLNGKTINTKSCLSYAYITVRAPGVKIENGTINFNIPTRKPVIGVYKDADVELIGVNVNATQVANGAIEIFEPNATVTLTNSTLETTQCAGIYVGGTTAAKDVSNAKVIIDGSTITTANTAIYDSQAAVNNHVTIKNNSTVTSNVTDSFGIAHNGTAAGYELTIENSTVKADNAPVGIFVSGNNSFTTDEQKGKVTITNSTVTGGTAVEAKFTNIAVTDSTITATQPEAGYTQNANGSCTGGYAIVVTDGTTGGATPDLSGSKVTISGGTYTGVVGLENGVAAEDSAAGAESIIDITAGTFKPVEGSSYTQEQMNEAVLGYIDPKTNNTKIENGSVIVIEGCVLGVTIIDGAQVRIGQGVDPDTGKVQSEMGDSGLRFIATVDRNGGNLATDAPEVGIVIYPEDKYLDATATDIGVYLNSGESKPSNIIVVPAVTFQDDSQAVFSAALINLKENNYNRKFTAKPYVKDGDTYYVDEQKVTRSIYQVAAGLLVEKKTAEGGENSNLQLIGEETTKVLNAYLNQVGVRLTIKGIANNGEVTIRDEASKKSGAYTGTAFFTIDENSKQGTNGVYTIVLHAEGDATFKDFWNGYIRINNNHDTVIEGITFDSAAISNEGKTLTFTFNYQDALNSQTQETPVTPANN